MIRRMGRRALPHLQLVQFEAPARPAEHVEVHVRIHERHPEILDEDVRTAWNNAFLSRPRLDGSTDRQMAIGQDAKGRLLEMLAQRIDPSTWLVYHAMTPPSNKVLKELRVLWRGR